MTDANGNTQKYYYETSLPYATRYEGAEAETFNYSYDKAGRNMSIQGELGTVRYGYNAMDYQTHVIDALGNVTKYSYDFLNNLKKIVLPNEYNSKTDNGEGISYEYDDMDHRISITDALGNVTAFHRDTEGRMLKEVNPNTYDSIKMDGEGISYTYDFDGRRTHIHYANGGIERIFYDSQGNIIKKVQPMEYDKDSDDGKGYTYLYDKENRLVQITNPEGIVEKRYVYDLAGRIIKLIGAEGYLLGTDDESRPGILYSYNLLGNLIEEREPVVIDKSNDTSENSSREKVGKVDNTDGNRKVFYRLTSYTYDKVGNVITEKRYLDYQTIDSARGKVNIIKKEYDKSNRLICVTDSHGALVEYKYNSHNQLIYERRKINDTEEMQTGYIYDETGRLQTVINSADEKHLGRKSVRTNYEYDKSGNIIKITTPTGTKIIRAYDMANRIISETHEETKGVICNTTKFSYDKAGNLIKVTDNNNVAITYTYDLLNRITSITGKNGGTRVVEYDLNGRVVKEISPNEYAQKKESSNGYSYTYDLLGRIKTITAPDGTVETIRDYDNTGRLISSRDAMGSGIDISYDFGGRRREVRTQGGTRQSYIYDAAGNIIGIEDGNKNRTEYTLDDWGRITRVLKVDGSEETYSYDYAGNIISAVDGEGNITTFTYNAINKLAEQTDPLGNKETYIYDEEGRLASYTNRNGQTIQHSYNCYESLTSRKNKETGEEETFCYNEEGLLKYAISGGMRYDYTYYPDGSLKEKRASGKTLVSYAYDLNGNKIEQTDISGKKTRYSYNQRNLLELVYDNDRKLAEYIYYPDGRIKSIYTGTDIVNHYEYDIDKNLIGLKTGICNLGLDKPNDSRLGINLDFTQAREGNVSSGNYSWLVDNHYQYDPNGNCIGKETQAGSYRFAYDSQNRLIRADYPTYTESFYYDKAGNRTRYTSSPISPAELANPYIPTDNMAVNPYMALLGGQGGKQATPTGSIEIDYQYGPGNRLLEMTKRNSSGQEELTSFEYDPQGNLLKDGRASYTYDSFNRLQKVETFGGQIQINRYDAEGLRHEIEENNELIQFIYSDRELIVETDTNGELTRYIRGLGIISSDIDKARTYYHYCSDELGSITHILDEEGQILNHYEYDAFGNTTICEETVSNRFRYTGQQYDKVTEQYYLRARYYNPIIGRFLQEDSYYNDGLNLYAYCENNPVRYIDPSGYTKVDAHDKLNGNQQASMDGLNNPQKKMTWNEFQHANKGKYTKAEMSEAWSDYKKSFDINTPKADVPNSKPTQADAGLGNEGGSQAYKSSADIPKDIIDTKPKNSRCEQMV